MKEIFGEITHIERRPCPYYSSYHIEELDITLADGTMLPVILKEMTLVPEARDVKPVFLFDPQREIEVYRDLLAAHGLGTAKFYGATGKSLYLENVKGDLLWQVGDVAIWRAAARWLARLHRTAGTSARLIRYDEAYYRQWIERANIKLPAYKRAVEILLSLPVTFIHGEFYPSNVIVQGNRICPIDWEMAALGPGLMDLAALCSGEWAEAHAAELVRAYGDVDPVALDACRLHLAVRWLGWSKQWTPPREHAQNWLEVARSVAERL